MKARAVVSDDIQRSREVEGLVAVAVLALVGALDVAEVSGNKQVDFIGNTPKEKGQQQCCPFYFMI